MSLQPRPTPPSCYCCSALGLSTSPSLTRIHVLTPSWNASSLLRPRGRRYVTSCSMTSRARHPPGDCPTRGLWWRHRCGERMGVGGGGALLHRQAFSPFLLLPFLSLSLSLSPSLSPLSLSLPLSLSPPLSLFLTCCFSMSFCLSGLLHLVSFTWHLPCNNQTAL